MMYDALAADRIRTAEARLRSRTAATPTRRAIADSVDRHAEVMVRRPQWSLRRPAKPACAEA